MIPASSFLSPSTRWDGHATKDTSDKATVAFVVANAAIPAGLPPEVLARSRVAHKTGDASTIAHEAGLVYLPDRKPYLLVVLSEWPPADSGAMPYR